MRPTIDGRRAAQDLGRLYGSPPRNDDAPIAANDRGANEEAGKHTFESNTTSKRTPRNWRGRLPDPTAFYANTLTDLVVTNGTGRACCPLHADGNLSLVVSLKGRGLWNCPACGHGDMIAFSMRLYREDFVTTVHRLVFGGAN